jgi:hypothetical protein
MFLFFTNMTFGYCFSPYRIKLATSWNGLESSWLKGFFKKNIGKNKKELEFNQTIIFFHGGCLWLQGSIFCRIFSSLPIFKKGILGKLESIKLLKYVES